MNITFARLKRITYQIAFKVSEYLWYIYEGHFYVCRIGLYLYKYRIYGTISIYILKGLASVYQLIQILLHLRLVRSRYIALNRAW